jgi:hypothetical protein
MDSLKSLDNAPNSNAPPPTAAAISVSTPTHSTSGAGSHTPSPGGSPITSMEVEDVEHETEDVHRSSVRDAGSMGSAGGRSGGRPPRSKKPKNVAKPSAAWDHFTRDESSSPDEPMAHCNYCGAGYNCHPKYNGTSSLLYHVRTCAKYRSIKAKQDKGQTKFTFGAKSGEGGSNSLLIAKYDEKKIRNALTEMIIEDEMPFIAVEGRGFQKFMSIVEPRFKVPSRITMMRDCVKMYLKTKSDLKQMFITTGQRVCVTTDTWTSIQNMNYMCVTAHFIDSTWKLHKRLLAFRLVGDHRGITIGRELYECLLEWGIGSKILTVTADNASSNETALDWFRRRTIDHKQIVCGHDFLHVRCSAHVLNLVVRDGLNDVDDSIVRVRNAVKYVKSSPKRLERFKSCASQREVECQSSLVMDVPTRWNSTYCMLEVAEKYKKAFDLLQEEDEAFMSHMLDTSGGRRGLGPPTDDDWKKISCFVKFLKVFYDVTMKISGSLYSTSNLFFRELCIIHKHVKEYAQSSDPLLGAMARRMKVKYDKYWGDFVEINRLLFVAVILDPRYKMATFEFWCRKNLLTEMAEQLLALLKDDIDRLFDQYARASSGFGRNSTMSGVDEVQSRRSHGSTSVEVEDEDPLISEFRESQNLLECKNEMERYFQEGVESSRPNFDILNWWKVNSTKFPVLSEIARDVLAIPVTTVASESAFSTGGRVLDPYRSSLAPKTVEALICTQNWLRSSPISFSETYLSKLDDVESYKMDLGTNIYYHKFQVYLIGYLLIACLIKLFTFY